LSGVYVRHLAIRRAVQACCVWMVIVVGIERVYAGQHWPSDLLGGFWFGGLIVAALILLDRRYRLRHTAK
jgi:undecaprenyl-diphosphatase